MSNQGEAEPAAGAPVGVSVDALGQLAELVGCAAPLVGEPLGEQGAVELARVFKALGDPVRLRLLSLIGAHAGGEACVCDLTAVFELTGPTISHHLKVLREAGLILGQRRGTWIYYRVRPELLARLSEVLTPATQDPRTQDPAALLDGAQTGAQSGAQTGAQTSAQAGAPA